MRFQLNELTESDMEDMDDIVIVSEMEALVGNHVHVGRTYEIREERAISPYDGVRWIFLARNQ